MRKINSNIIRKEGGASFDEGLNELKFEKGFIVSLEGIKIKLEGFNDGSLKKAVEQLKGWKGFYGAWINEGWVYIDRNIWIEDKEEALETARAFNQLAVWDCKNNKEIYL